MNGYHNFKAQKSAWFGERYFVAINAFEEAFYDHPSISIYDNYGYIHGICTFARHLYLVHNRNYFYIDHIATSGVYHGIGKALMCEVFRRADEYSEEVRLHSSEGSMGFYEHIGMGKISLNEYYCNPQMLKELIRRIEQELHIENNIFEAREVCPADFIV